MIYWNQMMCLLTHWGTTDTIFPFYVNEDKCSLLKPATFLLTVAVTIYLVVTAMSVCG